MSGQHAPEEPRGARPARLARRLVAVVIPLAVGAWFGYQIAYSASADRHMFGFGEAVFTVLLASLIGLTVLVGIIAIMWRGERGVRVARLAFAAAGLLAFGGYVGRILTPALGLDYREPVVLSAAGEVTLRLDGTTSFVPMAPARATCHSVPDGDRLEGLAADELGRLRDASLRAELGALSREAGEASVSLWIPEEVGGDSVRPQWDGQGDVADLSDGARSGRITFRAVLDPGQKAGEHSARPGVSPPAWPPVLTGELAWACAEW